MTDYTPPKPFIRGLRDGIKAAYPRSKGTWRYGSLVVKPFKSSNAEFMISFDKKQPGIIAEYHGFDWGAKGSNTGVVSFPQSNDKFNTVDGVISFLKDCIEKYLKHEQDFYDEGKKVHMDFSADEEEAIRLAGIIYPKGFLQELGMK